MSKEERPAHLEIFEKAPGKTKLEVSVEEVIPKSDLFGVFKSEGIWVQDNLIKEVRNTLKGFEVDKEYAHHYTLLAIFPVISESAAEQMGKHALIVKEFFKLKELIQRSEQGKLPSGVLSFRSNDGTYNMSIESKEIIGLLLSSFDISLQKGEWSEFIQRMDGLKSELEDLSNPTLDTEDILSYLGLDKAKSRRLYVNYIRFFAAEHSHIISSKNLYQQSSPLARLIRDLFRSSGYLNQDEPLDTQRKRILTDLRKDRIPSIFRHWPIKE